MTRGVPPGLCTCLACCPWKPIGEPPPRGPRGEWGDVFAEFDKRKESKMTQEEAVIILDDLMSRAPSLQDMGDNRSRADGGYWRGVVVGLLYRNVPAFAEAIASLRREPTPDYLEPYAATSPAKESSQSTNSQTQSQKRT